MKLAEYIYREVKRQLNEANVGIEITPELQSKVKNIKKTAIFSALKRFDKKLNFLDYEYKILFNPKKDFFYAIATAYKDAFGYFYVLRSDNKINKWQVKYYQNANIREQGLLSNINSPYSDWGILSKKLYN